MTKLDPAIIEEAIRLQEAEELYTMKGLKVHYSCYALASAQGRHYDDPGFNERQNPYLKAYKYFTYRRFCCDSSYDETMPAWWNSDSDCYKAERLENLRLFKEAVEKGENQVTTRIGEILPGKKLDPWAKGMEKSFPDGADVIILQDNPLFDAYGVQTLDEWHNKARTEDVWYVHRDNIKLKGPR